MPATLEDERRSGRDTGPGGSSVLPPRPFVESWQKGQPEETATMLTGMWTSLPQGEMMDFTIDSESCALLIVDLQFYFTRPDYPLSDAAKEIVDGGVGPYFERVNEVVIPNTLSLQSLFRSAGAPVMYTEFGSHLLDGSDLPGWARRSNAFSRDVTGKPMFPPFVDPSARVDDRLSPLPGEPIFQKTTTGTVAASSIDHNLRARGIRRVFVTGVATDYCVTQTARELADRDFDVCIVEDACASTISDLHVAALRIFAGVYGWVASTGDIVNSNRTCPG